MSAPTGNTNATKWTEAHTIATLDRIEKYAQMDHVHTLSRALVKARIYQGIWIYWKKRWIKHEEIMDRIGYIEQIFMMKIEEGGLSKRWHAGMCLFMLQVNYGQRDLTKRHYRQHITDELPAHLVSAYDQARQADRDIEAEKENKHRKLEEERAREERAKKKAAKQKAKEEKEGNIVQPEFTVYKNMPADEQCGAVQVVDINRRCNDGEDDDAAIVIPTIVDALR